MFRSSQILLVASALLVWSCEADDDSGTTENGGAGAGGESNSGASAGTQSGGSPSAGEMASADTAGADPGLGGAAGSGQTGGAPCGYAPECCAAPDAKPCRGLSEAECSARDYCGAVIGTRYDPADPMGEGGVQELAYLGCHSRCRPVPPVESCIYREDSPMECWHVPTIPDENNWVEFGCYTDQTQCE